jgi:putative hydrolase of the HAD superfamily
MTPVTRAVLFDFGGTLYDYRSLARAEAESLSALAEWSGVAAAEADLLRIHRDAMRRVFRTYVPRPFYRHRDMFRDAVAAALEEMGARPDTALLDRYRALQWDLHRRDIALRDGVVETLTALRARGLHTGIVSNIDDDQLDHLLAVTGIRPHFDAILSSERAGSCKPDPAIFATALARAGCAPGEALFVGDTLAQDVAGANRAGLRSVLLWHRPDRELPADAPIRPHHVIHRIPELLELLS